MTKNFRPVSDEQLWGWVLRGMDGILRMVHQQSESSQRPLTKEEMDDLLRLRDRLGAVIVYEDVKRNL